MTMKPQAIPGAVLVEQLAARADASRSEASGIGATPSEAQLIGECVDDRHPTLRGRVLVRIAASTGSDVEQWLPTLQGLSVRAGDRVLLCKPANWSEAVVTGVVDGFARRPRPESRAVATLKVRADEVLRVVDHNDQALAEIAATERGPLLRILHRDSEIELEGELRVSAEAITLRARQGEVRLDASADVVVQGETIHLN
jgi:hypothetical protein